MFRFFLLFMDSFRSSRWPSLSSFFCSCPAPVFRIYDPPCIFWPFLSCFTSSCVVSVRISVRLFCVPSTCIVSCIWLSFSLQSSRWSILWTFFLFAVLSGSCLSVLAMYFVLSSTLQTPPFLLNWYQNKVHVTPSVPFHLHCSVVCPDILSTVHIIRILCPIGICEGGGGVREGHGPWVTPARALVFLNML